MREDITTFAILDSLNDAVIILDKEFNFIYINDKAAAICGKPLDDLKKSGWNELINESFRDKCNKVLYKGASPKYDWLLSSGEKWYSIIINCSDEGYMLQFIDKAQFVQNEREKSNDEKMFKSIFENAAIGISVVNPNGDIVSANPALINMLGYTEEELLKLKYNDITYPEDKPIDDNLFNEILNGKRSCYQIEKRYVKKDRKLKWARLTVSAIKKEANNPVAVIGMIEDVTETRKGIDTLKKYNDKMNNILESISDAFFALNSSWNFTYMNNKAESIIGKNKEELMGKNIWDVFPLAKKTRLYEEYHRAIYTNVPVYLEEYYSKLKMWISMNIYPSKDGLSIYFRDISDKKYMEDIAKYKQKQLESFIENMPNGILIMGTDGVVIYINRAVEEESGIKKSEVMGKNYKDLGMSFKKLSGESFSDEELPFIEACVKRTDIKDIKMKLEFADEKAFIFAANASPLFSLNGEIDYVLFSINDITKLWES